MKQRYRYRGGIILIVMILLLGSITVSSTIHLDDSLSTHTAELSVTGHQDLVLNINLACDDQPSTSIRDGLLTTHWTQNAPYNMFCPMDLQTSARSIAGCPAVAMAQIINYHMTTNHIQLNDTDDYYHNYGGNTFWIDNDYLTYDFPSFPDLTSYLDILMNHYENQIPLTDEDMAALVFSCGVTATQVYSSSISGTFGVNQAYEGYLRFDFEQAELLTEDDPDLYDRMQQNIEDGLPVHIAVVNEAWTVGHNMVVDGYNTNGRYHINFGWGGSYDGWYKIPEELPFDLTVIEGIIVDIYDDNEESDLQGSGVLQWTDVTPGSTVEGSFQIENCGSSGSEIDWEIQSYPEWGEWIFTPSSGEDLTPEDGPLTIDVSVVAPLEKNEEFGGYVKIVDSNDASNSCLIHVSLATPQRLIDADSLVLRFLHHHPLLHAVLHYISRTAML